MVIFELLIAYNYVIVIYAYYLFYMTLYFVFSILI
jgi:hypothetical protein